MESSLSLLQVIISFLENMNVAGLSMITWIVVFIIIAGLGFIIRGNKS